MHVCIYVEIYTDTYIYVHMHTDVYALIHLHPCAHMHACMCVVVLQNQS